MTRAIAGLLLALTLVSCVPRATAPPERPVPARAAAVADSTEEGDGCCSDWELLGIVLGVSVGLAVSGLVGGGG